MLTKKKNDRTANDPAAEKEKEPEQTAPGAGEVKADEAGAEEASEKKEAKEEQNKEPADVTELKNQYLRLAAEYENYRKRTAKERENLYQDAVTTVVASFLPVADNIERALAAASESGSPAIEEGIALINKQIMEVFVKLGVEEIEGSEGTVFDPALHNAVMHVEGEGSPDGASVIEETYAKGYKRGDRVIRHAMVKTRG